MVLFLKPIFLYYCRSVRLELHIIFHETSNKIRKHSPIVLLCEFVTVMVCVYADADLSEGGENERSAGTMTVI